jgi:hypothetical protein
MSTTNKTVQTTVQNKRRRFPFALTGVLLLIWISLAIYFYQTPAGRLNLLAPLVTLGAGLVLAIVVVTVWLTSGGPTEHPAEEHQSEHANPRRELHRDDELMTPERGLRGDRESRRGLY